MPITATHTSSATAAMTDDWDNGVLSDEDDRTPTALPGDPEPELEDLDIDAELPEDPDMVLPGGRPTRAQARQRLRAAVDKLTRDGTTEITIRDLPDPETVFGRTRQWLSGELAGLARDGVLEETGTDGKAIVYRPRMRDAA